MTKRKMRRRIADLERRVALLEQRAGGSVVPSSMMESMVTELRKTNPYRYRGPDRSPA